MDSYQKNRSEQNLNDLDEQSAEFQEYLRDLNEGQEDINEINQAQEVLVVGDFDGSVDYRQKLSQQQTHSFVGLLQTTFTFQSQNGSTLKLICNGTGFLIQLEEISLFRNLKKNQIFSTYQLYQRIQEISDLEKNSKKYEDNYFVIQTVAHNLRKQVNPGSGRLQIADKIVIYLGKYQATHEQILRDNSVLKLTLDSEDILIPSLYKHEIADGGYDIALIGLSKLNKQKLNQYLRDKYERCFNISKNFELLLDDFNSGLRHPQQLSYLINHQGFNGASNFLDLYSLIFRSQINHEESQKFQNKIKDNKIFLSVCGYPGDINMQNIGFPQVKMDEEIDRFNYEQEQCLQKFKEAKMKNLIIYRQIQTSPGQSGSPITVKIGTEQYVVGVHTGGMRQQNFGTYFQDFLGMRELFKDYYFFGIVSYQEFDSFLRKQEIQQLGEINQ